MNGLDDFPENFLEDELDPKFLDLNQNILGEYEPQDQLVNIIDQLENQDEFLNTMNQPQNELLDFMNLPEDQIQQIQFEIFLNQFERQEQYQSLNFMDQNQPQYQLLNFIDRPEEQLFNFDQFQPLNQLLNFLTPKQLHAQLLNCFPDPALLCPWNIHPNSEQKKSLRILLAEDPTKRSIDGFCEAVGLPECYVNWWFKQYDPVYQEIVLNSSLTDFLPVGIVLKARINWENAQRIDAVIESVIQNGIFPLF